MEVQEARDGRLSIIFLARFVDAHNVKCPTWYFPYGQIVDVPIFLITTKVFGKCGT